MRRYFDRMPLRYRRFRRERQGEGWWYRDGGYGAQDLNPLEVDVILLALMRGMRGLLADRRIAREFAQGGHATLKTMHDLFRTQVAVDEATDFSPVRLACMAALSDPAANAFVACGDFNQRITAWGSRSEGELKWVAPNFDVRSINISYRHSKQLNELARKIAFRFTRRACSRMTGKRSRLGQYANSLKMPQVPLCAVNCVVPRTGCHSLQTTALATA